jgi:tRNA A37 methylthiotransferase MiaB
MREKTHAAYKMEDDIPEEIKLRRLQEVCCYEYLTL